MSKALMTLVACAAAGLFVCGDIDNASAEEAKTGAARVPNSSVLFLGEIMLPAPGLAVFDLRVVPSNTQLRYTVRLLNKTGSHLEITQVKSACGCLVGTPELRAIADGESVTIDLRLFNKGDGPFARDVLIQLREQEHASRVSAFNLGQG